MAGTSPDRSKRYESSTESTPGNEPPIPAPGPAKSSPDPRLAMSREAVPKVDQATAVFSRRALLEAAEAQGLTLDDPETGTDSGTAKPAVRESGATGTAGTGTAGAGTTGAEVDAPVADDPETGRAAAADAEGAEEADSGAEDSGDAGSDVGDSDGSGADAVSGGGEGADEPAERSDDDADAATEARADTAEDERADSEPAAEAGTGEAGTREADTREAGASSEADADAPESDDAPELDDAPAPEPESESADRAADSAPAKSDAVDSVPESTPKVDQPTAIFRAPRPPAVDQPTTMLKLGGGAAKAAEPVEDDKPGKPDRADKVDKADGPEKADAESGRAGAAKGTEGAARSDDAEAVPPAERTSKFVALKPLDEPAAPRPPAAAPDAPKHPAVPDAPAISPAEATRTIPQVGPERTTQQPLPPKPPLDLLAELTNTPPPRQTPVRTIIRRVKIWTPLAILLVIVFAVAQSFRPLPAPALALTADESYAFKGDKVDLPWPAEGQGWMDVNGIGTMDSFGEQKPVAIGSVAKAMTAYVILKEHPMKPGAKGATIPVDAKAETEGGYDKDGESTLNTVKEGDTLSQYDAIAAIMIPSANNIARLLARWDSNGSEEAFVKKMNAAAKDLGMKNTKYTDPSGLKETTVSTAEDQVKLGNELVKMKALTDITRLPSWKDPSGQPWSNYNRLVPYNNAIGIKTGSTTAAGGNLLFAGTQEVGGETAIVVGAILGQHTPPIIDTVNAVSKTAMLAAQEALTSDTILKKGDVVGYVDDGLGGQAPVVATKNVSAVGWAGKTVKLELDAGSTIPHEAKSGTEVGSLIIGDGSGEGVEVPVALRDDLTEPGFTSKLTRVS
ncbi:D-alanyl-D-alanine carboxypeptidase [Streptomyces sp. NBC_00487]|uniref:D-alanyl-D-alanine carboxypeptidase n=1 Tax=unclassified Streptomyces TaxID=2593676 RepID=UPI002E192C59|nr:MULTISPECIES: D-alanyl-D-alanine carboxypeptidase [unclassified Streptomyces]